jgi:DNA-binding MarR family transcriptional regulator
MEDAGTSYSPEEIRDLFHRKALAASRHRAAVTRQLGLNDTEAEALAHLARSGGMTPSQLGALLGMTSGGVTALTQRLERAGHVSRQPHPRDKRSSILRATPGIVEQVQEHYQQLVEDADRITGRLSADERRVIGRYLEQIVAIGEKRADEATAAVEEEETEPHEPVELWA